jgi:hypothetical protein
MNEFQTLGTDLSFICVPVFSAGCETRAFCTWMCNKKENKKIPGGHASRIIAMKVVLVSWPLFHQIDAECLLSKYVLIYFRQGNWAWILVVQREFQLYFQCLCMTINCYVTRILLNKAFEWCNFLHKSTHIHT